MQRSKAIGQLSDMIAAIELDHPIRVGIDGVDCSGKTVLANELNVSLRNRGCSVIRASIDGFHNPKTIRIQQGDLSPRGYFEDSFDLDAICSSLLQPLGPNGDLKYQTKRYNFRSEMSDISPWMMAQVDAILIFEGVFLHRPELEPHFDFTIFVEATFDIILKRALLRDCELFGGEENVRRRYSERYIPGQKLYLESISPQHKADVLFVNNDIQFPTIIENSRSTMRCTGRK